MSCRSYKDVENEVSQWWSTSIIDMEPGRIQYSGYLVQDLIGSLSFVEMIWLMLKGELPNPDQARLLECALVASVDHGPQAPSIAIARMAATCGVGLNNAIASAVNVLGDVHGGAGEQAAKLYYEIANDVRDGLSLEQATHQGLDRFTANNGKHIPGFGHRFHPIDPRAPKLLEIVDRYVEKGMVSGEFAGIARQIEFELKEKKGKAIPLNIDGASAVIYAELGLEPELARGLFCLSRSVGILAHAWEQSQLHERNKGPLPKRFTWHYDGPATRTNKI